MKARLQKQMLERRQELAAAYRRSQATNRRSDDGPLDLADTATELYTQEFNYGLSEKDGAEMALIAGALERIDLGDYGECEECGKKISEERLKAIPWAPLCIDCQEEEEARKVTAD